MLGVGCWVLYEYSLYTLIQLSLVQPACFLFVCLPLLLSHAALRRSLVRSSVRPSVLATPSPHTYIIPPSHRHTVTPSHHHTITPSHHHTITPSHHHTITPSHRHTVTPSHRHTVTPSHHYSFVSSLVLTMCHRTPPHRHTSTSPHHITIPRPSTSLPFPFPCHVPLPSSSIAVFSIDVTCCHRECATPRHHTTPGIVERLVYAMRVECCGSLFIVQSISALLKNQRA